MDRGAVPPDVAVALGALALAVAAVQLALFAMRRWWRRRRLLGRFARAAAGERRGADLLVANGYRVLGAQVAAEYPVCVDGATVHVALRADYLVTKGGATYVAEVKTGAAAPRIETSSTRRQLLEYRVAFAVDGVLLVDADADAIHTVRFPRFEPSGRATAAPWPIVALAIAGMALVAAALSLGS